MRDFTLGGARCMYKRDNKHFNPEDLKITYMRRLKPQNHYTHALVLDRYLFLIAKNI
jgi:hypothetical protein